MLSPPFSALISGWQNLNASTSCKSFCTSYSISPLQLHCCSPLSQLWDSNTPQRDIPALWLWAKRWNLLRSPPGAAAWPAWCKEVITNSSNDCNFKFHSHSPSLEVPNCTGAQGPEHGPHQALLLFLLSWPCTRLLPASRNTIGDCWHFTLSEESMTQDDNALLAVFSKVTVITNMTTAVAEQASCLSLLLPGPQQPKRHLRALTGGTMCGSRAGEI